MKRSLGFLALLFSGCTGDPVVETGSGSSSGTGPETTEADTSTGDPDPEPMGIDCSSSTFEQSRATWDMLQAAAGSTYYLQASVRDTGDQGDPLESGCAYLYTMQVIDGVPSTRTMVPSTFGEQDLAMCTPGWEESGGALGTNDAPLEPWTMEMHYERCEQAVLSQDAQENAITFCTFDNGALAHCSYFPLDCAEGCSMGPEGYASGIDLSNFGFGLAPA